MPKSVQDKNTSFYVGDIVDMNSSTIRTYIMDSGSENKIGFAYTFNSDGTVKIGGTGAFAGISLRKEPLVEGDLEDGKSIDLLRFGNVCVNVGGAGSIGALIKFNQTTGALTVGTAGAGETQISNCIIFENDVAVDGLGKIRITN